MVIVDPPGPAKHVLASAVDDDHADCDGADDLHGGQEQRGQPCGAVAGAIHLAGQPAELLAGSPARGPET